MPMTVVQGGSTKLRAIEITLKKPANGVLGPGGAVLTHGQQVRMPEGDAYTLVSGEQAKFITEQDAKQAAK